MLFRNTSCCGLTELEGISYDGHTAQQVVLAVKKRYIVGNDWKYGTPALLLFTGVTDNRDPWDDVKDNYGGKLQAYIKKHGLGECVAPSRDTMNENSGNRINAWIWRPNWNAISKHTGEKKKWKTSSSSTRKAATTRRGNTRPATVPRQRRRG